MNDITDIKAIHEIDLESTLINLKIMSNIKNKKIKCKFCKKVITVNDIYALYPESGSIKIICSDYSCVEKLLSLIREDKIKL